MVCILLGIVLGVGIHIYVRPAANHIGPGICIDAARPALGRLHAPRAAHAAVLSIARAPLPQAGGVVSPCSRDRASAVREPQGSHASPCCFMCRRTARATPWRRGQLARGWRGASSNSTSSSTRTSFSSCCCRQSYWKPARAAPFLSRLPHRAPSPVPSFRMKRGCHSRRPREENPVMTMPMALCLLCSARFSSVVDPGYNMKKARFFRNALAISLFAVRQPPPIPPLLRPRCAAHWQAPHGESHRQCDTDRGLTVLASLSRRDH